ncbi:MAG: PDZ domain-containing protein [Gemmatimonadaceae bacterium]|nr:PDZ domain-containing protein [Gemmatimonadaceae bacterium]
MQIRVLIALGCVASAFVTAAEAQERRAPQAEGGTFERRLVTRGDEEHAHRAALGVSTGVSGTMRDTLGLLITSVTRGSPAEKAGLEEGNRIAAINSVNLRANAADVDDGDMSGALARRLTRELGKVKPGDEVELRVYRDGRTQALRVKTADSDTLFRRGDMKHVTEADMRERPVIGIGIGNGGNRRDTLGVLVVSVSDSSPAARAGLEEGNRIAAINGTSLRVSLEDAGDFALSQARAQRLRRTVESLKPGDNVTLKVYGNGQWRDVTLKVARAGDLPRQRGLFYFGEGSMMTMPPMPPMPAMPPMAPMIRGLERIRITPPASLRQFERVRVSAPMPSMPISM